jgi:lipopolysaccharide export system permease protein
MLPYRISKYLGLQFLVWLAIGFGVCAGLILMADLLEVMRKGANKDLPFSTLLGIAVFRLPNLSMQVAPFAFLFGTILCFTRLSRSRELVVVRASGVSVWQFLAPGIIVAVLLGVFVFAVFNPISTALNYKAAQLESKYFDGQTSTITVSKSGLWLKQQDDTGQTIITAANISPDSRTFKDISVFRFDKEYNFVSRIDAKQGVLEEALWQFKDVIINNPGQMPQKQVLYTIPTLLTLAQIQDSFGNPDTISFWELPEFINMLEVSGFSALKHRLYFHTMLTTPVIFAAMVIIASVFSLKFSRRGKTGLLIVGAVSTGFVYYFASKLVGSYGVSGNIPVFLAAWTPSVIFIFLGLWLLLQQEDG